MGTLPHRPVVALDLDGTTARYHEHFLKFAQEWLGRPLEMNWEHTFLGEFNEALGLDKHTYRQIKLAYRQGGMKRTMPLEPGAKELVDAIHGAGAEVWFCTTRPWERFDNVDPDTRHFFERNDLTYEGLIYGEEKYSDLVSIVGKDRIVAVLDDLPDQYRNAQALGLTPILRLGDHNKWFYDEAGDVFLAGHDLNNVRKMILRLIEEWKEARMANESSSCGVKGCRMGMPHSHGTDAVDTTRAYISGDEVLPTMVHDIGNDGDFKVCQWIKTGPHANRYWYTLFPREENAQPERCRLPHPIKDQIRKPFGWRPDNLPEEREAMGEDDEFFDDDLPGAWSRSDFEGGDPDTRSYAERERDAAQKKVDQNELYGAPMHGVLAAGSIQVGDHLSGKMSITPPISNERVARVCNIMDDAQALYRSKAEGYGDTANFLGAKGQFADINRKFWKLYQMIWTETIPMYPDRPNEDVEQILMDFIGHAALTVDFLREDRNNNKDEGSR